MINILNEYEIVINELLNINYEIYGIQNYKNIKMVIERILPQITKYRVRHIFKILIELKYIKKIYEKKRKTYLFINPYKRMNKDLFIVKFD